MKRPFQAIFEGWRLKDGRSNVVTVGKYNLHPRNDLVNHSPDGFNWGYLGSGPSQLALGILAHLYGNKVALKYYQDFKFDIIAGIKDDHWTLSSDQVHDWLENRLESKVH